MREIPRLWDGPWLARARVFAAVRWINTRAPERLRQERWRPGHCLVAAWLGLGSTQVVGEATDERWQQI